MNKLLYILLGVVIAGGSTIVFALDRQTFESHLGSIQANSVIDATAIREALRWLDIRIQQDYARVPTCSEGQVMQVVGGSWACGTLATPPAPVVVPTEAWLYNKRHTELECTNLVGSNGTRGKVYNAGGVKICRISGNSCQARGWFQYQQWTATGSVYCEAEYDNNTCWTNARAFSNTLDQHKCTSTGSYAKRFSARFTSTSKTCTSPITEVGCY